MPSRAPTFRAGRERGATRKFKGCATRQVYSEEGVDDIIQSAKLSPGFKQVWDNYDNDPVDHCEQNNALSVYKILDGPIRFGPVEYLFESARASDRDKPGCRYDDN